MTELTYFVGLGAQKAGTTWLSEYLYKHPDVFMSPYKEMRYFDSKWCLRYGLDNFRQWWRRRDIDLTKYGPDNGLATIAESDRIHRLYLLSCFRSNAAYRALLRAGAEGKKAAGEITPSYTDLDARAFRDIDRCLPGCKFILLARNPADRLASQIRMDRSRGHVSRTKDIERVLQHPKFKHRGDYRRTISELTSVVAPERLLVLFYENLFDAARGPDEVARICRHLNIAFLEPETDDVVNASAGPSYSLTDDDRRLIVAHHAPVYEYMAERFADELPENWRRDMRLLDRPASAPAGIDGQRPLAARAGTR